MIRNLASHSDLFTAQKVKEDLKNQKLKKKLAKLEKEQDSMRQALLKAAFLTQQNR
jgi:valyl-tRNA synthetase